MAKKNQTLIDRLTDIIDTIHLEEVKNIVQSLTKINLLKHTVEENLCEDTLYDTIKQELSNEFKVNDFSISVTTNKNEKTIYRHGEQEQFPFSFSSKLANNTLITIKYYCEILSSYEQITLNTYLKEIVHLLYIQHVLKDLKNSVTLDPLTQLETRISFDNEIKTLVPLARRENMRLGLMIINIDRFQAVNDEHGNQFGDQFLKLYAKTIKQSVRTSDIVVRFSGGEFLVLLINIDMPERAYEIADKIREKLSQTSLKTTNGDYFKKSVCIGVSVFPDDSDDIDAIIKNADIALNEAQSRGRNQVQSFKQNQISTIELF